MKTPFEKGQKAKQLVGIYKNPYNKGTYEHDEWKRGFDSVPTEPINYDVELPDCSDMFDEYEPININK